VIKIFTVNDCSPEFVELQVASFKKHLQEDFEYTVCNGGETIGLKPDKAKEVSDVCRALSIPVIEIQRDEAVLAHHCGVPPNVDPVFAGNGRYRHIGPAGNYVLQWTWEKIISKQRGAVAFLHSDVFLIEPIKFTDYLKEHMLCSVMQHTPKTDDRDRPVIPRIQIDFLWEPFTLADMDRLPEPETMMWWPARIEGTWGDTGIQTYYYLKAHPEINLLEIRQGGYDDDAERDFHPTRYQFFHIEGKRVLHYMDGSRWCTDTAHNLNFSQEQSDEYHARKLAWTRKLIGV
jgi:hypothetical protein